MTEFQRRVFEVVRRVPAGMTTSYGAVALAVGGSPRAVGSVMKNCGDASVPCQRVIAADRRLGGYGGKSAQWNSGQHIIRKKDLLRTEGVRFDTDGKVTLDCFIQDLRPPQTPKRRRDPPDDDPPPPRRKRRQK